VFVALGLSYLLSHFAIALVALKLLGGGYLLYLAFKSAQAVRHGSAVQITANAAPGMFRRGLLLNLLNPKAALAWVAALTLGSGSLLSVALCALTGLLLYVFYATIFSLATVMAFYRRAFRWIEVLFASVFALAGIKLLLWRANP
jgi:threonine/homoserine/homoserine lactone efflux protein